MKIKKDYALCGWLLYYIMLLFILFVVNNKYSHAMLFLDVEKPLEWGTTPSTALYSVIGNYTKFLYLGLLASLCIVIRCTRKGSSICSKEWDVIVCVGLAVLSNIASLIYIFLISSKYNEVLYEVNNPIVNTNGDEILLMNALSIPIVFTILGIIGLIASGFFLMKRKQKK